ncbi:MAG TPA: hypothetical protein VFS20_13920 [Longimicrobium sp.]|nr:hypothetical protein [Longimicrobium sp.]
MKHPVILPLIAAVALGCGDTAGPAPDDDRVRPAAQRVVGMALSNLSTCALTADGLLHCWGENRTGEFGDGTTKPSFTPVPGAGGMALASVHGSMGTTQMCGITANGTGYCWGFNERGELGAGYMGHQQPPVPIAGGLRFRTVSTAYNGCGVATDGRVYCWGSAGGGQLGTGADVDSPVPAAIASAARYSTVTTGTGFSCALREADGRADCWGSGAGMGSGPPARSVNAPTPVSGDLSFTRISAGVEHVCALADDGQAWCWGNLGPAGGFRAAPERVPGERRFVQIASGARMFGYGTSCGLTEGGEVHCWHDGQAPIVLPGNRRFAGITGGYHEFCGYTAGGAAFCWRWAGLDSDGKSVLSPPVAIPALSAG